MAAATPAAPTSAEHVRCRSLLPCDPCVLQAPRTRWNPSPPSTRLSRSSARVTRQAASTPADDIPVFDRNKVSLDFPGNLFGPSVSLLIRTTKIIGDVIQNSAVRYQSFLRLFRPLFRGQFQIKGLDPPTTTTTTTTTTAQPASAAPAADNDNEINRRR
ncbi:jg23184 [Pararge aegeria aegeria]|uniref:Jg23184 protein n=1 Tax=Pararge aegeria aegeria TaxID=348720 RepID=A0A8S4QVA7_9NEOP|nr:jg23184 [Pararge aegeria aegeria]